MKSGARLLPEEEAPPVEYYHYSRLAIESNLEIVFNYPSIAKFNSGPVLSGSLSPSLQSASLGLKADEGMYVPDTLSLLVCKIHSTSCVEECKEPFELMAKTAQHELDTSASPKEAVPMRAFNMVGLGSHDRE